MANSGYVFAGVRGFGVMLKMFLEGTRGSFQDHFTKESMSKFLSTSCSGFLHSYGEGFPNKKKFGKYSKKEAETLDFCRNIGVFDNCNFIVDSGGFQISIGRMSRKESQLLLDNMYYDFLVDYKDKYDKAFILDVPPGPGCQTFKNFKEVFDLNLHSYQKAKNLPEDVRNKIIYVHHFRTPKLWDIFIKILREYEMFNSFQYHATGGIAANMATDMSIPCIIYTLPLIPLINEAKKYKRNFLNFHILGGASFRDILFYELTKILVKDEHGIDLNITYDSSGPFKQLMTARFLYVLDDQEYLRKMDLRKINLNNKFLKDRTVMEMFQDILNWVSDENDFKRIDVNGVYGNYLNRSNEMVESFHHEIKIYSILYMLALNPLMESKLKAKSQEIYKIYKSGDIETFYTECFETTRHINQGKITSKQKVKTYSLARSLDMLKNLDEEYCHFIVRKNLIKDEFTELLHKSRVLTI